MVFCAILIAVSISACEKQTDPFSLTDRLPVIQSTDSLDGAGALKTKICVTYLPSTTDVDEK